MSKVDVVNDVLEQLSNPAQKEDKLLAQKLYDEFHQTVCDHEDLVYRILQDLLFPE